MNEIAESKFESTWDAYGKALAKDYSVTLAQICRRMHTNTGGMSAWMSRRGYTVAKLKSEILKEYYHGRIEEAVSGKSTPRLLQITPGFIPQAAPSLFGISITFNSGTTISIKEGTSEGVLNLICKYEGKEGEPCIL